MDGQIMETKADEIALKMSNDFKCSNACLQQFRDDTTLHDKQ
jgi:hypothetical protein